MDLGTANSIIIHNDKIVVDEPSVVAIQNKTDKVIAVGTTAHQMEGKESPGIRTIRPLRDGVIADFDAAEQMIRGMVKMVRLEAQMVLTLSAHGGVYPLRLDRSGNTSRARLKRTRRRTGCLYDLRTHGRGSRHWP